MMKISVIILLLIILSFSVFGEADINKAYTWLLSRPNTDVFGASLTALAVAKADSDRAKSYIDYIKSKKHPTQACWPSPTCSIKDTAGALIVETKLGLNMGITSNDIVNWLASKQTLAPLSGNWNLQIITRDIGECTLRYQRQGEELSSEFILNVDKGKISYGSCKDQYFFNLNSCLGVNILNKPSTIVEVSCQSIGSASISIVYTEGNSIYLISNLIPTRARITINNGFFGNKLDTLYVNWALKEANSDINSFIYLKKNQENSVLDQSLLYLITKDVAYLNNLLSLQSNFGQFRDQSGSTNEFTNGLSGLALQESGQYGTELESLKEWLGTRQRQDGSWSGDDKTTAMILFGVFRGVIISDISPTCGNNIKETGENCDGIDLGGKSCNDLGFSGGTLSCNNTCSFNTNSCTGPSVTSNCVLSNPNWLNKNGIVITKAKGWQAGRTEGDEVLLSVEGNTGCNNKQISFDIFEDEQGQDPLQDTLGPIPFNTQEGFVFVSLKPTWFDDNPLPDVEGDPEFYFIARATDVLSVNSSFLQVTKPLVTECSDGIDNDKNGLCDTLLGICINESVKEGDPGCRNPSDLVENENALACVDGIDNDGDEFIDASDPGCREPFNIDNSEVDGECLPEWSCDPWSPCSIRGTQTRICRDLNACGEECSENNETCTTERECSIAEEDEIIEEDEDETEDDKGTSPIQNICFPNDICEFEYGEDQINCPEDCKPKDIETSTSDDGIDFGKDEGLDIEKETEEGRSSFWLYIILTLFILIIVVSYFFIFKRSKGGKRNERFGLPSQPSRPPLFSSVESKKEVRQSILPQRNKKSGIEDELERSLREAKRLIGK